MVVDDARGLAGAAVPLEPHSALSYRPPAQEAVTHATVDGLNMSFALAQ